MIVLQALNMTWLSDAADQCAHGQVRFGVGDTLLVDPEGDDLTVSAAGLHLLRTLEANHELGGRFPDDSQLFPHCGFFVVPDGDRCTIISCPEGVDVSVVTDGDTVTLRRGELNVETTRAQWRDAVLGFVRQVEAFYESSPIRQTIDDPFERDGWQMFWQEWHRRVEAAVALTDDT